MHGVERRGDECKEVAAVEMREALRRNRKEIKAEDGGEYSAVRPKREAASPENTKEQRNQDDVEPVTNPDLAGVVYCRPAVWEA
jgi:hypothetical protein